MTLYPAETQNWDTGCRWHNSTQDSSSSGSETPLIKFWVRDSPQRLGYRYRDSLDTRKDRRLTQALAPCHTLRWGPRADANPPPTKHCHDTTCDYPGTGEQLSEQATQIKTTKRNHGHYRETETTLASRSRPKVNHKNNPFTYAVSRGRQEGGGADTWGSVVG